jgi:tripartite-type tricarboxylate transporter receptor subunit TctC
MGRNNAEYPIFGPGGGKFKGAILLFRTAAMLIAFLIGAASVVPASAQAPYPNRPIRIVVPFGAGGFADITVRLLGQKLTERTGAQIVIENRPGAGGIIAGSAVTSSEPDGYTLFVFSSGIALSKSLLKSMPFDPVTAFAPISTMALFDLLLLVKADSPMHTLKDALDAARADPQKFNVGTINPGSTQNVTGDLLRATTGIPMTIVPHRTSAEVLTSLLRGDTQIGIESYAALKSAIDASQIRAVASSGTGVRRSSQRCRRCARAASTPRSTAGIRWWRRPARRARSSPSSTATSAPSSATPISANA